MKNTYKKLYLYLFYFSSFLTLFILGSSLPTAFATVCTGGTITYSGGNTIHTFTTSSTLNCTSSGDVEVLVVGGGGSGWDNTGNASGGGGGGKVTYNSSFSITAQSYPVTVGAGTLFNSGSVGGSSVFSTITSIGGNSGAGVYSGPGGTSGNNFSGGAGFTNNACGGYRAGGGGGGASQNGSNATSGVGGNGGTGLQYSISGTATYYGGGGGGGADATGNWGTGGLGGGGRGGGGATTGVDGTPNTGGGGGGSDGTGCVNYGVGKAGGSGIVIVSYTTPLTVTTPTATSVTSTSATLGANVTSDGGATSIAFDNSASLGAVTASSLTTAFTTGGSNRILFVGIRDSGTSDNITGVTYAGVAMTRVDMQIHTINLTTYLYYLIAPATGSNNVVVSRSSSGDFQAIAASYTGAKQSGQPDSSAKNIGTSSSSLTIATTTVANNSWLVGYFSNGAGNQVAGAGTVLRQVGTNTGNVIADSNSATTPAGSDSLIVNFDSGNSAGVIASFAPAALTRGTCWATTAAPTTNCLAEGGTGTGVFTHTRTGLPSGTLIYYRGYATNSVGTSYSADGSFTTPLPVPTTTAINPTSGLNNTSISIISISGTNFVSGATVRLTKAAQSDISCTGFTFTNSTTLSTGSCPITGAASGAWNVVVTNPDAQIGTLSSGFTVGALLAGSLISSTLDTGITKGVNYNSIMWKGALGTGGTNYVTFQFAASNCAGGQTNAPTCNTGAWAYLGPGGSTGTVYTTSGPNSPVPLNSTYYVDRGLGKGARYYRYKIFLQRVDSATSPTVTDVIVNWSP